MVLSRMKEKCSIGFFSKVISIFLVLEIILLRTIGLIINFFAYDTVITRFLLTTWKFHRISAFFFVDNQSKFQKFWILSESSKARKLLVASLLTTCLVKGLIGKI